MSKCIQCGKWEIKDGFDDYCAYCGFPQLNLNVAPEEFLLILGMTSEKEILFSNKGAKKLNIEILPEKHLFKELSFFPSNKFELPGNQTKKIKAKLDSAKIVPNFKTRRIHFKCHIDGDREKTIDLNAIIKTGPRPEAITKEISFGEVTGGTKAEQSAIILNDGGIPLGIKSVKLEGKDSSQFQLKNKKCSSRINPGERLKIPINWNAPKSDGILIAEATLNISFSNFKPGISIPIKGTSFKLALEFTPSEIEFEGAVPNRIYRKTVKLRNLGSRDIEIKSIEPDPDCHWISLNSATTQFTLKGRPPNAVAEQSGTAIAGCVSLEIKCTSKSMTEGAYHGTVNLNTSPPYNDARIKVAMNIVKPHPCVDYVGIDFGTTNSVVAIWDNTRNRFQLIEEENPSTQERSPLIPSVLVFGNTLADYKIGYEAESIAPTQPGLTARSVKHIMGSNSGRFFHGQKHLPQDLCSLILKRLVEMAEQQLYKKNKRYQTISKAIVTVPSSFYDIQIREILAACNTAGLEINHNDEQNTKRAKGKQTKRAGIILDEPSAAAYFFLSKMQDSEKWEKELDQKLNLQKKIHLLVYDHGGGTLDISIIEVNRPAGNKMGLNVIASRGSNKVGGDKIDLLVMEKILSKAKRIFPKFDRALILSPFKKLEQKKDRDKWDQAFWARILGARDRWKKHAEKLKIQLSQKTEATITIKPEDIFPNRENDPSKKPQEYSEKISRKEFESIIDPILKESVTLVDKSLNLGGLSHEKIDYIIHSGRTSLIPIIQENIKKCFSTLSPEKIILEEQYLKVCVALGAAKYGVIRETPGASVYFINGGRILPHSYGIQVTKGMNFYFKEIIKSGHKYPVKKKSKILFNGQDKVTIRVLQNSGSNNKIEGNPEIQNLGDISIPASPEKGQYCTIEFNIDVNRKLEVNANGKEVEITPTHLENEDQWIG